ncbi:hypothetical protein [Vibrio harveyi]|uniref:hypothetical protein n=1 Tax=Vibrio harveyi TaxID=669 RepID=UPI001263C8F7|nr:hypothetical protein [Vibrio harveyi]QFQ76882.1 hypothetical protein F9277_05140 [Vibrio harveyi]
MKHNQTIIQRLELIVNKYFQTNYRLNKIPVIGNQEQGTCFITANIIQNSFKHPVRHGLKVDAYYQDEELKLFVYCHAVNQQNNALVDYTSNYNLKYAMFIDLTDVYNINDIYNIAVVLNADATLDQDATDKTIQAVMI